MVQFLTNKGVLALSVTFTAYTSIVGFFFVSFGPYLLSKYQIPGERAGQYFLPFTVIRIVAAPLLGYLTDYGFAGVIFTCFSAIIGIPPFLIFGIAEFADGLNNIYLAEELITFMGISSMACFVSFVPLIRKIYQTKNGTYNVEILDVYATAFYCLCFGTGMAFGQSLMGEFVRQNVGFNSSCLVHAAILLTSNAVSLFYLVRGRLLFE